MKKADRPGTRRQPRKAPLAEEDALTRGEELTDVELEQASGGIVFTSVSNVLKTRHDTAKNSIAN
jgi:hypothetical protein